MILYQSLDDNIEGGNVYMNIVKDEYIFKEGSSYVYPVSGSFKEIIVDQ